MEPKFGGKAQVSGTGISEMKAMGKKSMEWDLNDWKWDGDLFRAAPLNSEPSDCRSRQFFPSGSGMPSTTGFSNCSSSGSDDFALGIRRGKRELEKRRKVVVIEDDKELNDEGGSLNLKLGGQVYPVREEEECWVERNGRKTKLLGTSLNHAVCQVDDCRADLSNAKDYHRRHKVCEVHSKATRALVGTVMQRFCQQCSRFHALQEFDEGKRSCRRRLAGHNRRRRKTHPDNSTNGFSMNDERSSNYLLISLLRILSNIQSNGTDYTNNQDLLSHILMNLANLTGPVNGSNLSGLTNGSQDVQDDGPSGRTEGQGPSRPNGQIMSIPASGMPQKRVVLDGVHGGIVRSSSGLLANVLSPSKHNGPPKANDMVPTAGRIKLNNIDLNNIYNDSEECMENLESADTAVHVATGSPAPLWVEKDSSKSIPPQASGNSGSTSAKSPSGCSIEAQSRTDRIVFKLFGKDPSEFPLVLRSQILDWLKHSPTDIESYIRPGCIILSVYLRMEKSKWEELCCDLSLSLRRLLDSSYDPFWKTGWVYTRVRHHVSFLYDGQVVLGTPLPLQNETGCKILSIKPIAVSVSERVQFSVTGFNIQSTSRLICALQGKYLVQQNCSNVIDGAYSLTEHEVQSISFSCSIPDVVGRGFIEVEDNTLSSSFFPFIVAEKDVCSEIRTLESDIEVTEAADGFTGKSEKLGTTYQALDFVHELGWLLHRNQSKYRLGSTDPNLDLFPFRRLSCIMKFSIDRDWCAVVKKLLGILFSGIVDAGGHPTTEIALLEIGLLHRAVRRNCRPMVETLLSYRADNVRDRYGSEQKPNFEGHYLFRPDAIGPGGLTPLHLAASRDGSESVLDALTDDPQLVGIKAWTNARDSTGLTPHDYACQQGRHSYIHMVEIKLKKKMKYGHVVIDIPSTLADSNSNQKTSDGYKKSTKVGSLETEKTVMNFVKRHCSLCKKKLAYGNVRTSLALYRPVMLSMVAIAAVCVCAALLFKSSPEVSFVLQPFRWELLKYGSS